MNRENKDTESKKHYLLILLIMMTLSLGLNWPYLGSGFTGDEVLMIKAMNQDPLPYSRWRGAWSGESDDLSWFGNPWWAEPGAIGSFFRPLPSLVIEGSVRLFGNEAFPLHLLAVLLHGAIGFLIFLLVKRLSSYRLIPLLAGLVFVICEDHSMTVGFISCITDILCVFFVGLSLLFHLSFLEKRKPAALLGTIVAMLVALGCKETAAIAPLVLVLTSLFFPQGMAKNSFSLNPEKLRTRVSAFLRDPLSWAPALGLLVIYLGLYQGLNLGGMNNLSYIDPLANPGRYLAHLVIHLPVMWLATLSPIFPSIGMFMPKLLPTLAVIGLLAFVLFLWALWPHRKKRLVVWAFLLYLAALLPQLGTDAGERSLYFPYVFACILIALLVKEISFLARRFSPTFSRAPRITRIFGWYLLIGVIVLGIIISIITPFSYVEMSAQFLKDPLTAAPHIKSSTQHVLILNTRSFFSLLMLPSILKDHTQQSVDIRILSAHTAKASIERSGDSGFILHMDRKGWLSNFMAGAFRAHPKLEQGKVYRSNLFDATLIKLLEDRSDVLAVRFDMHCPLNAPNMLFLYWDGRSFQPMDVEALPLNKIVPLNPRRR